jgi:F-type H+-transporting ATPase subunit b
MEHQGPIYANPVAWVAVAFFLFFLLFGARIWKAVTAILDKRAQAIRTELAEAQRLRAEAEAMLRDASTRREAAFADVKILLQGAHQEAARLAEAATIEAEAAGHRREKMALDRIAAAEKAAINDVRIMAAEIAAAAARQVILETLSAETDAALVNTAIARLPTALAPRRAA